MDRDPRNFEGVNKSTNTKAYVSDCHIPVLTLEQQEILNRLDKVANNASNVVFIAKNYPGKPALQNQIDQSIWYLKYQLTEIEKLKQFTAAKSADDSMHKAQ